jgi:hypothetical protein
MLFSPLAPTGRGVRGEGVIVPARILSGKDVENTTAAGCRIFNAAGSAIPRLESYDLLALGSVKHTKAWARRFMASVACSGWDNW